MALEFHQKRAVWLLLAVAVIAFDYLTKQIASSALTYGVSVEVMPMFNWTLLHNYGAAFSFLSDQSGWQRWFFAGIALVVSAGLVGWLLLGKQISQWEKIAIALVLGGALGNLYDRMVYGYVIDFIHVYYDVYHFPAFNFADTAISIGAAILVIDSLFMARRSQ
ncbi:signal peptidase II [Litoribrevibacter albus]|uniref:Lipoprotein signal peptidase n=1 Tax=Litoribrevibacter albus TaxID=1473156 RepID=A0AA37W8B2_9GAMM|nr:signal peptidase II [Litoribrevibacter albus]GLQ33687.1 lipoprotein signal peptidase [Litoribrevibacter albus]